MTPQRQWPARRVRAALVLGLGVWVSGAGAAASFNCASPRLAAVERLVCGDDDLSALDVRLADSYEVALMNPDSEAAVRAQQSAWLMRRNRCADAACLRVAYEDRVAELACVPASVGSGIGASTCYDIQLRRAERELLEIEARRAREVIAASDNPRHAERVLADEARAWRPWRDAYCALQGELEGGASVWKHAWALSCALDETQQRIARLRKALSPN